MTELCAIFCKCVAWVGDFFGILQSPEAAHGDKDAEEIYKDWEAVGNDMRIAMGQPPEHNKPVGE